MSKTTGSIISVLRTPLGAVLMLVVTLILAGLSVASTISGELTSDSISISYAGGSAVS